MVACHIELPADRIADICRRYRVKELSVFGSVLRDDFQPDSDVDLLVDFLPNHGLDLVDYIQLQEELTRLLGRTVDLVDKQCLKSLVAPYILNTARLVYAN